MKLNEGQMAALAILRGPQRHTLLVGGARSGKTFLFSLCILVRALKAHGSRHGVFRFRSNAVWPSIGRDTMPKVARINGIPLKANSSEHFFTLPEHRVGSSFARSEIWLGGLDEKERSEKILGLEFATLYINESSQVPYASYLMLLTRLAQVCEGIGQRCYVDLNPSGATHWTNLLFIKRVNPEKPREALSNPDQYAYQFLNPDANRENLTPEYIASLQHLPERQRRRFYAGEYLDEIDNALWTLAGIDRARIEGINPESVAKIARGEWRSNSIPAMSRIVVAVDPSGADGKEGSRNDDIGVVVVGLGKDNRVYLLADRTLNAGPAKWAQVTVDTYHEFGADCVVAEINYGGAMVAHVIKTAIGGEFMPVHVVTASRGKAVRAEPVSALYDENVDRARHVGSFPELEEELLKFSTAGYLGARSPNRADAFVWGVAELLPLFNDLGFLNFYGDMSKAAEAERKEALNGDAGRQNHAAKRVEPSSVWPVG